MSIFIGDASTYVLRTISVKYFLSHSTNSESISLRGHGQRLVHFADKKEQSKESTKIIKNNKIFVNLEIESFR